MARDENGEPIGLLSPPEKIDALAERLAKKGEERPALRDAQRLAAILSPLTAGIRRTAMQARQNEILVERIGRMRAQQARHMTPTPAMAAPQFPMKPTPTREPVTAPPGQEVATWVLGQARAALDGGAPRDKVLQRIRQMGIDPQEL